MSLSHDWIKMVESTDVGPTLRTDCNLLRKQFQKTGQVAVHRVGNTGETLLSQVLRKPGSALQGSLENDTQELHGNVRARPLFATPLPVADGNHFCDILSLTLVVHQRELNSLLLLKISPQVESPDHQW